MAKKIELRISNNVDTTKVFSANLRGGGRGIDDETMALESHSNEIAPTLRTLMNWILICEPMIEETNKEPKICAMRGRSDGEWHESEHEQRIECREDGVTNTITGVSKDNMVAEPTIIANTADFGQCYESKDVSPTVKSSAFQYNNALLEPVEQIHLNTDQDGLATTVTTAHHYSGNIVDPKRGQKEMDVLETQNSLPFRVRRLTERELFRLMDVSEEDIDKIQAAGISKTQQAKMAGNSIVVNVLYEIFRKMFVDTECETAQLELF